MKYRDLRDFIAQLESTGELKSVQEAVSPRLEMTAVGDAVLRAGGPALLFEQPAGYKMPCLTNLFGTPERVALGMGADAVADLRDVGRLLAALKEPEPPKGLKEVGKLWDMAKAVWDMKPAELRRAPCQDEVVEGADIDLGAMPGADLLAGRRRPADHLGPGGHPRAADGGAAAPAPEPGHLPPAGDRPAPGHHALAGAPRRRAGFPRLRARATRASRSRSRSRWAPTRPPSWGR